MRGISTYMGKSDVEDLIQGLKRRSNNGKEEKSVFKDGEIKLVYRRREELIVVNSERR